MNKLLILCSQTGGGHLSLAEALRDLLAPAFEVEIADPQPGIIHWHYRMLSRHALWLWAAEFKAGNTPARSLAAHKMAALLLERKVCELLMRSQPDLIMTTYPFLSYEVTQAMQRMGLHRPLAMLFSDPNGVHASWLTERCAAATFAPTRETYAQAREAGFAPKRLHLSGWPVRAQFYGVNAAARAATLVRLGLSADRFTVFLQGGGEGAARFGRTVKDLLLVPDIQLIVAVGTNQSLVTQFQGIDNLRTLPFTRQIAPFMAAADVVMGKAGPNMLFEAVTLGKPFVATAYIPGQEEVNLEFIQRHQLGWVALTAEAQRALIQSLTTDPLRLQAMRNTVDAYRQWNREATTRIPSLTKAMLAAGNLFNPLPETKECA